MIKYYSFRLLADFPFSCSLHYNLQNAQQQCVLIDFFLHFLCDKSFL